MSRTSLSHAEALTMRAARAAEDPREMTLAANETRMIRHVAAILRENPDLTDLQVAKAARLRIRAEMAVLAEKSAAARRRGAA